MLKYLKLSVVQKGKLDLWQESVEQPAAAMVLQTGLIETQISVKTQTHTQTQTGLTKTQTCIKNTHKHKQVFQKGKGSQLCLKIATVCRLGQSFMVIYIQARRYIYFPCPMLTLLKKTVFFHVFAELYSFTR